MTLIRRNPLVGFFVLAYGLSWAYWIPLALRRTSRRFGGTSRRSSR